MLKNLSLSEKELYLLLPKTAAFLQAFKMAIDDLQILPFPFILPLPLRTVSRKTYQHHENKTK